MSIKQLRKFVEFDKAICPKKPHIATWALGEIESLTAERDAALACIVRMRQAGAAMANALFNMSQRGEMTADIRLEFKDMQIAWDAAIAKDSK